jgi:putative transcription factor
MHSGNNEDWDTVVLRKTETRQDAQSKISKGGQCDAEVRRGAAQNTQKQTGTGLNTKVLDENTDGGHIETVSKSTSLAIRDGRLAMNGMTQKVLASKVNILPNVLADYESGKAIPNQEILNKLEKVLGVHLRGVKCGQKIVKTPPKTK